MKTIHRAIRPSDKPGEYFLYNIEYAGDGFNRTIINTTMHNVDSDGIVGPNFLSAEQTQDKRTILAMINILAVDGFNE